MNCAICIKSKIDLAQYHKKCKDKVAEQNGKIIDFYYFDQEKKSYFVLNCEFIKETIKSLLDPIPNSEIFVRPFNTDFFNAIPERTTFSNVQETTFIVHELNYVPTCIEKIVNTRFSYGYATFTYQLDDENITTIGKWASIYESFISVFGNTYENRHFTILSKYPKDNALDSGIIDPQPYNFVAMEHSLRKHFIAFKYSQTWFLRDLSRKIIIRYGDLNKEVERFIKLGDKINKTLKSYGSVLLKKEKDEILVASLDYKGKFITNFTDSEIFFNWTKGIIFCVYTKHDWFSWNENSKLFRVFFAKEIASEIIYVNINDNIHTKIKSVDTFSILFDDDYEKYKFVCNDKEINENEIFADLEKDIIYILTKLNDSLTKIKNLDLPQNIDQLQKNQRLIVIGTINGCYAKALSLLRTANIIPRSGTPHWIGNNDILVQLGNLIGPEKESLKVLELFYKLKKESNGNVVLLMGENELSVLFKNWEMIDAEDDLYIYARSHSPTKILKTIQNRNNILTVKTFIMCYKLLAVWKCGKTIVSHGKVSTYASSNINEEFERHNRFLHEEILKYTSRQTFEEISTFKLNLDINAIVETRYDYLPDGILAFLEHFDCDKLVFSIIEGVDHENLEQKNAEVLNETGNLICLFNGNKIYVERGGFGNALFMDNQTYAIVSKAQKPTIEHDESSHSDDSEDLTNVIY